MPAKPLADAMLADIERLTSRDYAEIGVPMFLVAEDLTAEGAQIAAPPDHRNALLASALEEILAAIAASKSELDSVDISRAIELLADRYMLAMAAPEFSRIAEGEPN